MTYVYIIGLIVFMAIVAIPILQWLFTGKDENPRF
jgi:hypothetical protein